VNKKTDQYWEFYDLKTDPEEMFNEYRNPKYAKVIQQLKTELQNLKVQYKDTDEVYPELKELSGAL
jgi:predicted RNA-binding protein with EMAP domain